MPPPAYVCVEEVDLESRPHGNSESNKKIQDDSWKGTPFSKVRAAKVKRFHLIQLPKKQAGKVAKEFRDQLYYLRDANRVSSPSPPPSLFDCSYCCSYFRASSFLSLFWLSN